MFKKWLVCAVLALGTLTAQAVELNKGGAAELDALPGVGPAMSQRILDARKQGEFKDWADFMSRVKGVKEKTATKLSNAGLTVNGKPFGDSSAKAPASNKTAAAAPKK